MELIYDKSLSGFTILWRYLVKPYSFLSLGSGGAHGIRRQWIHGRERLCDYKLIHFFETGQDELYNLTTDLEEKRDLSTTEPQRTGAMRLQLRNYLRDVKAPMPLLNPDKGSGSLGDVDQDGLDDAWEMRMLLGNHSSDMDDPDGDGRVNRLEQLEGKDPLIRD